MQNLTTFEELIKIQKQQKELAEHKRELEIRKQKGITKEANAKIKELTRNGDLETLKDYKRKYWSYTTGMHIAEFSQQFMGYKLTKAKFEAIEHEQDKQEQEQHEEPEQEIIPTTKEKPKLVASPNPQQIEMFCDYVLF